MITWHAPQRHILYKIGRYLTMQSSHTSSELQSCQIFLFKMTRFLRKFFESNDLKDTTRTFNKLKPQQSFTCQICWFIKLKIRGSFCTYCPEFEEILDDCSTDHHTVECGVGQEQHKVFVVWESHTVIHPGKKRIRNIRKKRMLITLALGIKTGLNAKLNEKTYQGQWWSIFSTHLEKGK